MRDNFVQSYKGSLDFKSVAKTMNRNKSRKDQRIHQKTSKKFFNRIGAMNKFKLNTSEFHILQNIDKHESRIKDDVNIFYKRIEKQILSKE